LILTPITIYSVYYLLGLSYVTTLNGIIIAVHGFKFSIVDACVAVLAYYLLWILVLLTKDISLKVRIKLFLFGSLLIFLMNVFRIVLVVNVAVNYGFTWFNVIHLIFWKGISGVYVALVWIILVRYYNIRSIPLYDDLKKLYKESFK